MEGLDATGMTVSGDVVFEHSSIFNDDLLSVERIARVHG